MFRTVGGLSGLVQTPRAREALLHLASSPLGLGCGSGAPPRSCWECRGCTGHRDVCSEGSRGGGLSQSSRRSRIKTSSHLCSTVPTFLLLSVYGLPYCLQSSPPSPLWKCNQRSLRPVPARKGCFGGRGAALYPSQQSLSAGISELGRSRFLGEPDLRCLLLRCHVADTLVLLGEENSSFRGDVSCGHGFGGSQLLPSKPVTCFSRNCILSFPPLKLMYHPFISVPSVHCSSVDLKNHACSVDW